MRNDEEFDQILKQALTSTVEPADELNQNIINQYSEKNYSKRKQRKKIPLVILAAIFAIVVSITAAAATYFYNSKEVAEHLGNQMLAKAFESQDAIEINETISSGDYHFTLHGIVSGSEISEMQGFAAERNPERTYAVISVARKDGNPMPHSSDPEYLDESFFMSPLVKGLEPWRVNIGSMGGAYSEIVINGILYRLIECDGVEMFADREVYLAISSGSPFYNQKAFSYDESTGEIYPKAGFDGVSLLFDLPLDKEKADPIKAEAYLSELSSPSSDSDARQTERMQELQEKVSELKIRIPTEGTVIPESIKEVSYDEQGRIIYDYEGIRVTPYTPEMLFKEKEAGLSDIVSISGDSSNNFRALQFSRDEDGVITGRTIVLKIE